MGTNIEITSVKSNSADGIDWLAFYAANFSIGMAFAAMLIYVWGRHPHFTSSYILLAGLGGILASVVYLPLSLRTTRISWDCYPIRMTMVLFAIMFIGWVLGFRFSSNAMGIVLAGIGLLAFVTVTMRAMRVDIKRFILSTAFVPIGFALGAYLGVRSYELGLIQGYPTPLLFEEILRGNLGHIDTLFHVSISNMIAHYGIASTGLQGTPYLPYHTAVHVLFALTANALNTHVIDVFFVGLTLLVLPLAFGSLLRVSARFQEIVSEVRTYHLLVAACLLVLCTIGAFSTIWQNTIALWESELVSASAALGLVMFFLLIEAGLFLYWRTRSHTNWVAVAGWAVCAMILVAVAGFAKISVGLLSIGTIIFLVIRYRELQRPTVIASAVGGLLGFFIVWQGVASDYNGFPRSWFDFYRVYVKTDGMFSFIGYHFLWTICSLGALWIIAHRQPEYGTKFRDGLAELLVLLTFASLVPGFIWHIGGGSAAYFIYVAVYFGLLVFVAMFPLAIGSLIDSLNWRAALPVSFSVLIFIGGVFFIAAAEKASLESEILRQRRKSQHSKLIGAPTTNPLISAMIDLRKISKGLDRTLLADIPLNRLDYWKSAPCNVIPFVLPAVSGVAWLDGRPTAKCNAANYGYRGYLARPENSDNRPICDRWPVWNQRGYIASLGIDNQWQITNCLKENDKK